MTDPDRDSPAASLGRSGDKPAPKTGLNISDTAGASSDTPAWVRPLLEYGPLLLFLLVNARAGIFYGTAALVVATLLSLGLSWVLFRRLPKILVFGCAGVVIFGALTLIFEDELFIKIKPTVVSLLIACVLAGGAILGRNPLKSVLGDSMKITLDDRGWQRLTWLWVGMFCSIAGANEIAWRTLSTDGWVSFKVFGLTGISLVWGVLIALVLARYQKDAEEA